MVASGTSTLSFTMTEIGEAFDPDSKGIWYFQIPKFQRSLVWSQEQKFGLIDSIYRGFPIGIFLAYKTKESSGSKSVIQLVDGLQRVTAIVDYLNAPLSYMPVEEFFPEEVIASLTQTVFENSFKESQEKLLFRLSAWLKKTERAELGSQYHSSSLIEALSGDSVETGVRLNALSDQMNVWLHDAQKKLLRIENTTIPLSLFTGDPVDIPVIFERVNTQGAELTKYEILSSTWVDTLTKVNNEQIKDEIEGRFKILIDKGYEVSGVDANGKVDDADLNLFDYLSGLGALAHKIAPSLFGEAPSYGVTSPIGFVAACIAHGLKIGQMNDLPSRIERDKKGLLDPSNFEAAFISSVHAIRDTLDPYLSLRLNRKKTTFEAPLHSQNQIISMVLAYTALRFKGKNFQDQGVKKGETVLQAVPSHYLNDVISSSWKGAGDSRLFDTVWSENGSTPSSHYYGKPSGESLRGALRAWNQEQMDKRQKSRSSYPAAAKVLLKFLYADLVSVKANKSVDFEIEHIFPVSRLTVMIPNNDEGWPISAPGNLMILPGKTNRIKGKNYLGEIIPQLLAQKKMNHSELQQLQESYLLSPEWKLVKTEGKLTRAKYDKFVDSRFQVMEDTVLKNLGY